MDIFKILLFVLIINSRSYGLSIKDQNKPLTDLVVINLNVGEKKMINSLEASDLMISSKGIIFAHNINSKSWGIVGLKKGHVILKTTTNHWLIHVRQPGKSEKLDKNIPHWICHAPSITCHQNNSTIKGEINSTELFLTAKLWCKQNKPCLFLAHLSPRALKEFSTIIQNRLPVGTAFDMTPFGDLMIYKPCQAIQAHENKAIAPKADVLLEDFKDLISIVHICKRNQSNYTVSAKAILVNHSDFEQRGLDLSILTIQNDIQNASQGFMNKKIEMLIHQNRAQVIGQPVMQLIDGQRVSIRSGGEIYYEHDQRKDRDLSQSWKKYGMSIDLLVEKLNEKKVISDVSFSLTQPNHSNHQIIYSNNIKTKITLPLNQTITVGSIVLSSDQSLSNENSFFSKIPLMSIFFQKKKIEKGNSSIVLTLMIKEALS